jgi:hypothetical protein
MTGSTKEWSVLAAANLPLFALLVLIGSHREDFRAFYTAGVMWRNFPGTSLYDLHLQMETQRNLLGVPGLPFNHPPYEVVLYLPLSLLHYRAALWCWRAFSLLTLLFASYSLARISDFGLKPRDSFLISLSFFPVLLCLAQGQDSILLLAIISASAYLYASGHDTQAGAVLALGLFKFQFVLPIAAILALRRRGRFVEGFVGAGAAIVAISIAMVRPEGATRLIELLHVELSHKALAVHPAFMPNIHGLISTAVERAPTASLLTAAVSLALILLVGLTHRTADRPLELAVASCTATLVSFHMNPHDMAILLLPITLVVARLCRGDRFGHLIVLAYIATPVYLLCLYISSFVLYALPASALLWILMRKSPCASSGQAGSLLEN